MQSNITASAIIHTFEVTSADEALGLTRASELLQVDTFITAALTGLRTAKPVLDRYAALSHLATSIGMRASGNSIPITVAALEGLDKSQAALREFFNQDGPMLGNDLAEANANYAELNLAGIATDAPIQVPVLVEVDKKDGKGIIKSVSWLSAEDAEILSKFPESPNARYPGAEEFVKTIKDAKGKVIEETTYIVFSDYANRRISIDALADALAGVNQKVQEVASQVLIELLFVKDVARFADKSQNASEYFKKEQSVLSEKIAAVTSEVLDAVTRLRAFLNRERQLLIIRQESAEVEIEHKKWLDGLQKNTVSIYSEYAAQNGNYLNFLRKSDVNIESNNINRKNEVVKDSAGQEQIIKSEKDSNFPVSKDAEHASDKGKNALLADRKNSTY